MGHAQGMDAICSDPTCDRKHYARGFCRTHYMRVWRHGDINRGRSSRQPCSWKDGCRELSDAKGLCHKHYEEQRRRARGAKVRAPRGLFTPCSEGDGEPVVGDGLCRTHYMRVKRQGTTADPVRVPKPTCTSPEGCDEPQVGQGLCRMHYMRVYVREHRPSNQPHTCAYCGKPSSRQVRNGISYCSPECKDKAYSDSGRHAQYARKSYLQGRYGLSVEDADALAADGCSICGTTEWMGRHGGRPHVDHNHDTGEIRGILCSNCNLMLGYAEDSPARLRDGALYIESHMVVAP